MGLRLSLRKEAVVFINIYLSLVKRSATSMTGMAKVNWTCFTWEMSSTPWASTSPRKFSLVSAGKTKKEKKYASFDDVVKLVGDAKAAPENMGTYHDYIELCELYDKNENGTMMLAELENIISNLADEVPKEDTQALLAELADPEDEDGFFPYTPFLDRLCGKV